MSDEATANARNEKADALLGELKRERAGQLKVFLGAAPGVGKTYAMLGAARELKRQGVDVVVGIAETHGRAETEALLDGLEVLPRKRYEHRGRMIEELDLDALLARRPQVALVDELAHRNAPGSRHERRFQDIEELLDAGVDVYTTVNIQHLESLNDVVFQITGVRVRETVPDAFFDRLRDVVLIDLPPRELIDRLKQGKVYLPEQAAHALQAFFSPSNLTALRELAMQTAADRVDTDLREMRRSGRGGGVPVRRRVLVAIDGRGSSEYLVRSARRIAERRQAPWSVAFVNTSDQTGGERQAEVDAAFALARRLGGEAVVLRGADVVDELLAWANRNAVSTIVVGRTRERPFARMFNRTLTQRLLQRGARFELTIVNTPHARARSRRLLRGELPTRRDLPDYAFAVLASALAVGVAWLAERYVSLDDLSMVFIIAVLIVGARTRMTVAVFAAVLCFLSYNFFFIDPRFTFYIGARQGVLTVLLFLGAALIAGRLASRLRAQVLSLRAANAHATALQALGRRLAVAADEGEVMRAGREALAQVLGAEAIVLPRGGAGLVDTALPSGFGATDRGAAEWSLAHAQAAGRYTDTLGSSAWWFLPLPGDPLTQGVIGLRFAEGAPAPSVEQRRLAEAMVDDVAQALSRTRLVDDLEGARVTGETERLRAALLSSVSHDLRSPLAAMIGAAGSLASYGGNMPETDRRTLLDTIGSEGQRLDRYIQNLLDMTRLGHGGLKIERDWIGLDEILGAATTRLRRYHPGVPVHLTLPPSLPPLYVHPALVEQALFNVLENAAKFSPEGEAVTLEAVREGDDLRIDIADRGPGIPEEERRRIFDMFYTVGRGDRGGQGTGLGLTICQGMIGAHGGSVEALPGPDGRGTVIRIVLPLRPAPDDGEGGRE